MIYLVKYCSSNPIIIITCSTHGKTGTVHTANWCANANQMKRLWGYLKVGGQPFKTAWDSIIMTGRTSGCLRSISTRLRRSN